MPSIQVKDKLVTVEELGAAYNNLDGNKKDLQTAVSDPTASGTGVSFIDSISQNTQGVIAATKKTVPIANNLTTETAGSVLDAAQGKALLDKIKASIIIDSTTRTLTAGTSSAYSIAGLTSNHRVVFWNFSGSYGENNPPADITITTSNGSYTISVSNLIASGITMQPVFIAPQT